MNAARIGILAFLFIVPLLMVTSWIGSAEDRLEAWSAAEPTQNEEVAVASAADARYCSVELKRILRRVLQSCGLLSKKGTRGCQPLEAKTLATVSGSDFNALFRPMRDRGAIIQFDVDESALDYDAEQLVEQVFSDQKGASYFFIVARASPEGSTAYNRKLSKSRAEAVMEHLSERFEDPDLEKEVGLLWLGEEFAQLDEEYCSWRRSRESEDCRPADINRGAFVAWIDCRL